MSYPEYQKLTDQDALFYRIVDNILMYEKYYMENFKSKKS